MTGPDFTFVADVDGTKVSTVLSYEDGVWHISQSDMPGLYMEALTLNELLQQIDAAMQSLCLYWRSDFNAYQQDGKP